MSALRSSDVLIIGGGVMGSAVAYFLALRGASVVVLESDASYATASSALSASSIRQQFSTPVCMRMSRFGFEFMRAVSEHLSLRDEKIDVSLTERGYLYLANEATQAALQTAIDAQLANDAPVAKLSQAALAEKFPWLRSSDLALASIGLSDEGWFDGYALLQGFRRKARELGAVFLESSAVDLQRSGSRVHGVRTGSGTHSAAVIVNAAGFRAGEVARWAGVDLPIGPERRCVFAFHCRTAPTDMPLIIDPSGVYVRPDGTHFIAGGLATAHPGYETPCFEVDHEQFDEVIWPTLADRVPAFEEIRLIRGWAGQYDMNFFDHNAAIGWLPGIDGMLVVAGFSGHGMQHSAAAGRGVAELILDGAYRSLDLSDLDPARITQGRPLREYNLI